MWKSPKEKNAIDGVTRQTLCYKLSSDASGVQEICGKDAYYQVTEFDKTEQRFLLAGGGRGEFQRKFYAGQQVGSFLLLRDIANPPKSFTVTVRIPDQD